MRFITTFLEFWLPAEDPSRRIARLIRAADRRILTARLRQAALEGTIRGLAAYRWKLLTMQNQIDSPAVPGHNGAIIPGDQDG